MVFVLSVSNSRFGSSFLSSSLLHYFSHSFLAFNYGVADSITDFAYGKYFFNKIFGSIPLDFDYLGTHFDTSFITFVGTLYIDFGPIGTFLIAMIIPVFFNGIIKRRKRIDFSDLYIYSFYLNYLFIGVFVIGYDNFLNWAIALGFYKIFKI